VAKLVIWSEALPTCGIPVFDGFVVGLSSTISKNAGATDARLRWNNSEIRHFPSGSNVKFWYLKEPCSTISLSSTLSTIVIPLTTRKR
jgi:hypothetical protein